MINKLKRKFLILATVAAFALMTTLVCVMNVINYSVVVGDSDATIDVLFRVSTFLPDKTGSDSGLPPAPDNDREKIPNGMSPEVPYEARFFTVSVSPDGSIVKTDFSKILTVDENTVNGYVKKALSDKNKNGFIDQFRYEKRTFGQETTILFLDCGRKLDSFKSFLWTSAGVGLFGCVIVFIAFFFLSGKIVKPIAESYEKQKRFISDAGHEIKTPLTIINANLDLLESELWNEELEDIRIQTKRLSELTNNLVYLSKMEESEHKTKKIEIPLSDIVSETINPFKTLALTKDVNLNANIFPGITINGDPAAIAQLASILTENAIKYSPSGGEITISLSTSKKNATLVVFNLAETPVNKTALPHVFDRFYRADESRNSGTGGHGIGLSVAKAIVEAHGGNIKAETVTGKDFRITVNLPLK